MRVIFVTLLFILLSGCSGNKVMPFPEDFAQPSDLRDLDFDGVIQERDACGNTLQGAIVDNHGCAGAKTINKQITLKIQFTNGSSSITPDHLPEIKRVADLLKKYPYTRVTIEGHASARGKANINKWISLKRAKAVAFLLSFEHGINHSRIRAVGYGEEQLLDTADTPEAHERNRRVVANIQGSSKTTPLKWTIYTELED
ncbi:OmpA family protein [Enterovibrio sp. ZSDZ35]|uniref:OmpA family protein n=1 Tax=Enterovibrio qingdaonensis TaxID=2899818 RepID=A0ABT5QHJ7_9GAMM|nr:OmpA family protein [Enterovibrio sp. ZSDZ35]MDD1780456.1 OmpA family protein [Enterovibrio sp. ZSDZ35]